jgi:hypothetical protein
MRKRGHMMSPAKNDVMSGITVVDSLFRSGRLTIWQDGEGVQDLVEELGLYRGRRTRPVNPLKRLRNRTITLATRCGTRYSQAWRKPRSQGGSQRRRLADDPRNS